MEAPQTDTTMPPVCWGFLVVCALLFLAWNWWPICMTYYQRALAAARNAGDREKECTALCSIGATYIKEQAYGKAQEYYKMALIITRALEDQKWEYATLTNVAIAYEQDGQHPQALMYYREAHRLAEQMGDEGLLQQAQRNVAVSLELQPVPDPKPVPQVEPPTKQHTWDVFINYATEDKEAVALPLAERLKLLGLRVWLDVFELKVGDSLRRKIDQGLSDSRYGVVILSPAFFATEWAQKELDALAEREDGNDKVILPVWHNVTYEDIARFSLVLAGKHGLSTRDGVGAVARQIRREIR